MIMAEQAYHWQCLSSIILCINNPEVWCGFIKNSLVVYLLFSAFSFFISLARKEYHSKRKALIKVKKNSSCKGNITRQP